MKIYFWKRKVFRLWCENLFLQTRSNVAIQEVPRYNIKMQIRFSAWREWEFNEQLKKIDAKFEIVSKRKEENLVWLLMF